MAQEEVAEGKAIRREVVFQLFFCILVQCDFVQKETSPTSLTCPHSWISLPSHCYSPIIIFSVIAYSGLFFIVVIFMTLHMLVWELYHTTHCMEFTHLFGISAFQGLRFLAGKSFSHLSSVFFFFVYTVVSILCTLLLLI